MRAIVATRKKLSDVVRIVAFVKTDVLMSVARRLRTFDRSAIESSLQKFDVVRVCAAHFNAQRQSVSVSEYRTFGAKLATICRVFAGFFPRREAILSSLRLRFANSTGCLSAHRTPATKLSIACETLQTQSNLESTGVTCCQNQTQRELLSIGTLYAIRKRFRWQPIVGLREDDRPFYSLGNEAANAPSAAKAHQVESKHTDSVFSPLEHLRASDKKSELLLYTDEMHKCSVMG